LEFSGALIRLSIPAAEQEKSRRRQKRHDSCHPEAGSFRKFLRMSESSQALSRQTQDSFCKKDFGGR
jgi:hypothetical protein